MSTFVSIYIGVFTCKLRILDFGGASEAIYYVLSHILLRWQGKATPIPTPPRQLVSRARTNHAPPFNQILDTHWNRLL